MLSNEFLIAALIVVLIPGTGVLFTVTTAMTRGFRGSIYAALGCTAGILPAILAAFLGVSALLHMSAIAYTSLKLIGAAYLIYLAVQIWRDKGAIRFSGSVPVSKWKTMRTACLINVLNPKLSVFFMAFLPQFVDPSMHINSQLTVMSTIFMALTFMVFILYGALASAMSSHLQRPAVANWVRRSAALTFTALGARLALSEN